MARLLRLLNACLAAAIAGCAVGPDFAPPAPPVVERYTPGLAPAAPHMPRLDAGAPVPADWWAVFGSPELDVLVRRALGHSPTLDEANARLVQARELLAARGSAAATPQADLDASAIRQRIDPAVVGFPQAPNPGPFNVFGLGASASYDFDIFGGTRRALEAAGAEVDLRRYELAAARLELSGSVVLTAIRVAALDARIDTAGALLGFEREQLAIAQARLAAGGAARVDVQQRQVLLAQAEAALPPLRAARAQAAHLLAVLLGEAPAAHDVAVPLLATLHVPSNLPLRVPSELARERPDIRASEALLHAASANVGVATADRYPKLVVSGSFSTAQLEASELFGNGINLWSIGINLVQPLLRANELKARQRAAVAAFDAAGAAYRQAVLRGLQDVADALRALEGDAQVFTQRSAQAVHADELATAMRARFDAGGVSRLALLDAERTRSQAHVDWLQAQADRCAGVAVLLQALGGGGIEPDDRAADGALRPAAAAAVANRPD